MSIEFVCSRFINRMKLDILIVFFGTHLCVNVQKISTKKIKNHFSWFSKNFRVNRSKVINFVDFTVGIQFTFFFQNRKINSNQKFDNHGFKTITRLCWWKNQNSSSKVEQRQMFWRSKTNTKSFLRSYKTAHEQKKHWKNVKKGAIKRFRRQAVKPKFWWTFFDFACL